MAKNDFQYGKWNSYTLQCGMWLWNRESEFTNWQYPAMWHVALGWHAIEFAQTSAILEFYILHRPHHRSRHVILHQSPNFFSNRTTVGRKKWRHVDFQDGGSQQSWILGSDNGFSEKPNYITSYRSSIDTIALNCLVFFLKKSRVFVFWRQTDRQTNRRTNKQTNEQMDSAQH